MGNVLLQRQALPAVALLPQWLSGYAFLFGNPMNVDRAKTLRAGLPANSAGASEPARLRVDAMGDLMKLLGERVAVNARQANITIQVVAHTGGSAASAPVGLHLFAWHYSSLSARVELQSIAQYLHPAPEQEAEGEEEPLDPEKLYAQERHLLAERQILPLLLLPEYAGIASNVRNWSVEPAGAWRLADVWLEPADAMASSPETTNGRATPPGVRP
jgi:hypothetical protein